MNGIMFGVPREIQPIPLKIGPTHTEPMSVFQFQMRAVVPRSCVSSQEALWRQNACPNACHLKQHTTIARHTGTQLHGDNSAPRRSRHPGIVVAQMVAKWMARSGGHSLPQRELAHARFKWHHGSGSPPAKVVNDHKLCRIRVAARSQGTVIVGAVTWELKRRPPREATKGMCNLSGGRRILGKHPNMTPQNF